MYSAVPVDSAVLWRRTPREQSEEGETLEVEPKLPSLTKGSSAKKTRSDLFPVSDRKLPTLESYIYM